MGMKEVLYFAVTTAMFTYLQQLGTPLQVLIHLMWCNVHEEHAANLCLACVMRSRHERSSRRGFSTPAMSEISKVLHSLPQTVYNRNTSEPVEPLKNLQEMIKRPNQI